MNYGVCSFACCSFNGRYIYKFGGISEDNSITHYIVKYALISGSFWWKIRLLECCKPCRWFTE